MGTKVLTCVVARQAGQNELDYIYQNKGSNDSDDGSVDDPHLCMFVVSLWNEC